MWKYEFPVNRAGRHYWRLLADNGHTVATSHEDFYSESDAKRAARNVKANAGSAAIESDADMNTALRTMLAARRRH